MSPKLGRSGKPEPLTDIAVEGRPFSNSSEGHIWMFQWCDRCAGNVNDDCPLLTAAYLDMTPKA